jgi:hypothetical protein
VKTWLFLLLAWAGSVQAHEMTPAYPKLVSSHVAGVKKASLQMFNRRSDVDFYEIGVFTQEWAPISFVSSYRIFRLDYLKRVNVDVYIADENVSKATYVCSISKLRPDVNKLTAVSSRICSKLQ